MDTMIAAATTEATTPITPVAEQPRAEANGRVLGRVELPKPLEEAPVAWLTCALCGEKSGGIREEQAIVPNFNFVEAKLERKAVPEDLKGFVVCRKHANALEDRDVRCYRYLNSLRFLEKLVADNKDVDAFVGDFGKKFTIPAAKPSASVPPSLKTRPMECTGTGRDFASPQATKSRGKKFHNGGRRDNNRSGWADRE
ncbi:MAG: hypothetical protein G01um101429_691 [Parcubacteria group bacterium Gr01-1014_29]|nr:MAG: hypothetical protein G01um101429_691 [Parcubacteria group bacterium Gr01-1014_29]